MMKEFIESWVDQRTENKVTEYDRAFSRLLVSTWIHDELITPEQGENAISPDVKYSKNGFYEKLKDDFTLITENEERKIGLLFENEYLENVPEYQSMTLGDLDTILANIKSKESEAVNAPVELLVEIDGDKSLNEVKDEWGKSVDAS